MFSSFDIASIINWFLEMPEMQVYLWVMLLMTIESSFIPFPSEIVVPPAAYLAANQRADIWLVLLFATIGAALGAIFNYAMVAGPPHRLPVCRQSARAHVPHQSGKGRESRKIF